MALKSHIPKVCAAKRSEMIRVSLNDDIEIRLTKEGRKIYKRYCQKYGEYGYDPMKKAKGHRVRVQLWEFMNIFGSQMFMGAEAVIVGNTIRIPRF